MTDWTPRLDKLLREWKGQAETRARYYRGQASFHIEKHYKTAIPLAVTTGIGGAISLVTFRDCDGSWFCLLQPYVRLLAGLLTMVVAGLQGYHSTTNHQGRSKENKTAANDCESLGRYISTIERLDYEHREKSGKVLMKIREQLDSIDSRAPIRDEATREALKKVAAPPPSRIVISSVPNNLSTYVESAPKIRRHSVDIPFLDTNDSLAKRLNFEIERVQLNRSKSAGVAESASLSDDVFESSSADHSDWTQ